MSLIHLSKRNMMKKNIINNHEHLLKTSGLINCKTFESIKHATSKPYCLKINGIKHVFLKTEDYSNGDCFGLSFTTKHSIRDHDFPDKIYPTFDVKAQTALKEPYTQDAKFTQEIPGLYNISPVKNFKNEILTCRFIATEVNKDALISDPNKINKLMKSMGVEFENEQIIIIKDCLFRLLIESLFKKQIPIVKQVIKGKKSIIEGVKRDLGELEEKNNFIEVFLEDKIQIEKFISQNNLIEEFNEFKKEILEIGDLFNGVRELSD